MHSGYIGKIKNSTSLIFNYLSVKVFAFIVIIIGIYILHKFLLFSNNSNDKNNHIMNNPSFYATSVEIPDSLFFANERVPIENFDVYESLDREFLINSYWHSQTIVILKRAYRYFPIIEPILKKNNIPDDFKYLVVVESGFSNVVSPAGASGFWQFMKATAERYGLVINDEIDERYNLEKATEAAVKHIKDLYSHYKNWTLVAAAYNLGAGKLDKAIAKQKAHNYYDLYLNEETARYVYRILALKTILSNPKKYGFYIPKSQRYMNIPTEKFAVDTTVNDLAQFAIDKGLNYKLLKKFNPWIKKNKLTIENGKTYFIQLPKPEYRNIKKLMQIYFSDDTLSVATDSIE